MVTGLLLAAVLLPALSGPAGLPVGRWRGGERVSLALLLAWALCGLAATLAALGASVAPGLDRPWPLPGARLALGLDGLSAVFLLPVLVVASLGAVYGLGYWNDARQPATAPGLRLFYGLLTAAMVLLLTARNGLLFLVAWEVMALCGFFLIVTESRREAARRAGFVYLAATHTGTLALFALFALLAKVAGSFAFPPAASLAAGKAAGTLFVLALFGFGLKAGIMPLHLWLPGAHAAAPSHVSALLSGVMIKTGIYGLVRLTGMFAVVPPWWGWLVLGLGAVSAVLGVAFALAQHDLKRLLAYHSVENIGIIVLGLGLALLGRSFDLPAVVALGLGGALLHVINHGLFKSLLFLGAGSLLHATGTRQLGAYGGLLKSMPWTGLYFLGGAVAICGLPPLNGFVSEWLVYLGALGTLEGPVAGVRLAVLAAPVLALTGALALACFVKVFGTAFLGAPRSEAAAAGHEAPRSMLAPMALLLACCAAIGLYPPLVGPLLQRAVGDWLGAAPAASGYFPGLAPLPAIGAAALVLAGVLAAVAVVLRRLVRRAGPPVPTWGCGYAAPGARMQYTASSFAAPLVGLFGWGLRSRSEGEAPAGLLPPPATFACHTPDPVLEGLVEPGCGRLARACRWLRARVQNGATGGYLLYVALTVGLLLFLATLLRD